MAAPVKNYEALNKSPLHHLPPFKAPSSPDCPSQPEQEPGGGHQQQQDLLPPVQGRGACPGEGQGAGQEEDPHCGHRLAHWAGGQEGQSALTDPRRAPKRRQMSLMNSKVVPKSNFCDAQRMFRFHNNPVLQVSVILTDPQDHFFYYSLLLLEEDYHNLKSHQVFNRPGVAGAVLQTAFT